MRKQSWCRGWMAMDKAGWQRLLLVPAVCLLTLFGWADGARAGVVQVAAGGEHAVIVKSDGTLWAWGQNYLGQLGDGTTNNKKSPVRISTENSWQIVSAGYQYTVALKTDGSLYAWGDNRAGQLGDGTTTDSTNPVRIGMGTDWQTVATRK